MNNNLKIKSQEILVKKENRLVKISKIKKLSSFSRSQSDRGSSAESGLFPLSSKNGVAALPTMLLLGGLVTEIIIGVVATSYIFTESEFGRRLSSEAFIAGKAGIQDGIMKITLNKSFISAPYTLTAGNYSADVNICNDLPCVATGKFKITSLGKAQTRRRNLQAILNVDSVTGEVRLESLKEVQL